MLRFFKQFLIMEGSLKRKEFLIENGKLTLLLLGGLLFFTLLVVLYFVGLYGVMEKQSTVNSILEQSAVLSLGVEFLLVGLSTVAIPGLGVAYLGLILYALVGYWSICVRRLNALGKTSKSGYLIWYILGVFFLPLGLSLFLYLLWEPR